MYLKFLLEVQELCCCAVEDSSTSLQVEKHHCCLTAWLPVGSWAQLDLHSIKALGGMVLECVLAALPCG